MAFREQILFALFDKALVGIILLAVGYWLNRLLEKTRHGLGLVSKQHEIALRSQLDYKEAQISELYGPIYILLKQIRPLDDLWSEQRLGGRRNHEALAAIRSANNRIVELILTKSHLIDGDQIPEYFGRFLTHVSVWHAFLDDPKSDWSVYEELRMAHYDMTFEHEVFCTTESLKRELNDLRRRLSSPVLT
jgi:hypothetical protein